MINSIYLYLFFSTALIFLLLIYLFNFRPYKNTVDNKILLKNLLEGLDLDLPDELKALDNSSTDNHKLS